MLLSKIIEVLDIAYPDHYDDLDIGALTAPSHAAENDIVFLSNVKFLDAVQTCRARFVIVKQGVDIPDKTCLAVKDPYVGYAKIAQLFEDTSPLFGKGISSSSTIATSASIDPSASVGPGTVIGDNVSIAADSIIAAGCIIERGTSIGSNCRIDSGVVIRYNTSIKNNVIIQSGAIIGSDGFGNARENDIFIRIPAFGNVVIEDNAEVGANCTIDRGNFEPTIIGSGVKLDNLIHIAHNVTIGENTAMAAQTGISGSTAIGKRVIIAGQVGSVGHISIGDDSFIGAKSGISKNVAPSAKITGYPARDLMTMRRIEAAEAHLPSLLKEFKSLKKELHELKQSINKDQ